MKKGREAGGRRKVQVRSVTEQAGSVVLLQSCQHCGTVCASVWIVQMRRIKLDAFVRDCESCMILGVRFG